jgi:mannose-6-phosphate isomerase-like protein (cupin superfamily)
MRVVHKDDVDRPFLAPLGELIYELIGSQVELGGTTKHSFAHVVVPPDKLSPRHVHKVSEETYYILRGQAHVAIDGRSLSLSPGQSCLIMPGEVHQLFNHGADDLELLVVCAPPWTADDFFEI